MVYKLKSRPACITVTSIDLMIHYGSASYEQYIGTTLCGYVCYIKNYIANSSYSAMLTFFYGKGSII